MIDPRLERRAADCTELVDFWKQFLELVNKAVKPPKTCTPQLEQQFINTKARIAMLHDSFMESLKHDKQVGANMLEIVNRAITLRLLQKLNEAETKKLELEWHEVYLLLNEAVSGLNEERQRIAAINEFSHNMGKVRDSFVVRFKSFLGSIYLKIAIVLGALAFAIWGVPAVGIYDYDNLRDIRAANSLTATYLSISRNWLGFDQAFLDMPDFMNNFPNKKIVGFRDGEDRTSVVKQERVAADLPGSLGLSDRATASELMTKAKDYRTLAFESDGSQGTVFVYTFWFRKNEDARKLGKMLADATNMPQKFKAFRRANVVMVYSSDNPIKMDDLVPKTVDLTLPKP